MSIYSESNVAKKIVTRRRITKSKTKNTKSHYFNDSDTKGNFDVRESCRIIPGMPDINVPNSLRLFDTFYKQPCVNLAKALLGKTLVRKLPSGILLKGKIVETESYLGIVDVASHSYKGKRTERNEAMYLKPGTAYVYTIYGMYYCFNISSLEEGSAVLIRALEPCEGLSEMQEFRKKGRKSSSDLKIKELCNGPSKLCQALKIEKSIFNKIDLCTSNDMWLEDGIYVEFSSIISCKRIGIDSYGEEWADKPLRFYIKDNCFVSQRNKVAEQVHAESFNTKC